MRRFVVALPLLLTACPLALGDFTIGDATAVADAADEPDVCTFELCGGACVDTSRDPANCGSCGHACLAGHACVTSSCAAWARVSAPP